jgi:hypothetical protein
MPTTILRCSQQKLSTSIGQKEAHFFVSNPGGYSGSQSSVNWVEEGIRVLGPHETFSRNSASKSFNKLKYA